MRLGWRSVLLALPVLLMGWIGVLALVMRLGGPAPAALVILPPAGFLSRLPSEVAVTDSGPLGLVVEAGGSSGASSGAASGARGRDLVAELYRAGAPLVLPAGLRGCLAWGR